MFFYRQGSSGQRAAQSMEVLAYLEEFDQETVDMTFVITPMWTLHTNSANETLRLIRTSWDDVDTVSFSDGLPSGTWWLSRVEDPHGAHTLLAVRYASGHDDGRLTDRTFENLRGTSVWVRKPEEQSVEALACPIWLVPLLTNP